MRTALVHTLRRMGGCVFHGLVMSGLSASGVSPHAVGLPGLPRGTEPAPQATEEPHTVSNPVERRAQ